MDHRVAANGAVEISLLRRGRKVAIEEEIAGLQEIAVLGELLNRIAAIDQNAFVAVDKRPLDHLGVLPVVGALLSPAHSRISCSGRPSFSASCFRSRRENR